VKKATIALVAMATIVATIATFMPMKAILILSSGNVPTFFPDFMERMDPAFVAVLLLTASAFFAGVSWISWNVVDKLRTREVFTNTSDFSLTPVELAPLWGIRKRKGEPGAEILVSIFFGLILCWISPIFLLLTYSWLIGSLVWIRWRLLRENSLEPSLALKVEIAATFRRWIRNSAFPSTLGISLISLLTDQIRLEVTGALVAAILGRRLQMSFAALISQSTNSRQGAEVAPMTTLVSEDGQGDSSNAANLRDHPRVENASRVLMYSSEHHGLAPEEFLIVNTRNGKAASVVAAHLSRPSDIYFRVFNKQAVFTRDLECKFRSTNAPVSLFSGQMSRKMDVGKVPCIEVHVNNPVAAGHEVEQNEIRRWQIELEMRCLHSQTFQNWCTEDPNEFSSGAFDALLERVMKVPGAHQKNVKQLLNQSHALHQLLLEGPFVWVTDVSIRPSSFLRDIDGNLILIDPFGWRVARLGDGRSPNAHGTKKTGSNLHLGVQRQDVEIAVIRRTRNQLLQALSNSAIAEVDMLTDQLNQLLESFSNSSLLEKGGEARVSEL